MSRRLYCLSLFGTLAGGLVVGLVVGAGLWDDLATAGGDALGRDRAEEQSNALAATSGALARVAAKTTPSVVHIQSERRTVEDGLLEETGSGVIVRNGGDARPYVVTNRHVIRGAALEHVNVRLHDGRVVRPERLWTDEATDLAVLALPVDDVLPAEWADSDDLEIGHFVLALGSPFGLRHSVTLGILSARGRRSLRLGPDSELLNQDFLQTDAAINPGNSGGPLVDLDGRIVGINTAIASNSGGNDGIGFSIPSNLARRVVGELLRDGRVRRAYLGVKLDPNLDAAMVHRLRLDRVVGARVTQVYPRTPAARAELQYNDVVLQFDGVSVQDENHLINLVSLTPVDREVTLVVWRNGRRISVPVVLGDRVELEERSRDADRPGAGIDVEEIGLTLHTLNGDVAEQLGYRRSLQGLLVLRVAEGSPLSEHVRLYDVIEEIGGVPVATVEGVEEVLRTREASRSLVVTLSRRDKAGTAREVVVWKR